ncbi:MAG: choice-of-anchor A family protein [Bacilli bacterium]|nr:choice-of-anchor A family protein [Bacilli bacterium]
MKKKILILVFVIGFILASSNTVFASSNENSLDYLLEHYTAVTFGANDNSTLNEYNQKVASTNKGDIKNLTIQGDVLARGQYANKVETNADFDLMYAQIINESNNLVDNADYDYNSCLMIHDYTSSFINNPGIYNIKNNCRINQPIYRSINSSDEKEIPLTPIVIQNYQPDKLYVFNILDTIVDSNIQIITIDQNGYNNYTIEQLIEQNRYTGNIIFNYPNARYLEANLLEGTIIAPKADVYINTEYSYQSNNQSPHQIKMVGSIYANSITTVGQVTTLEKAIKTNSAKISKELGKDYKVDVKDNTDDAYYGDYSIASMLKNYSVVSLGHNNYQPNTKLASYRAPKGSVNVFHIAGPFLIRGDLLRQQNNWSTRVDMESNEVTEANINGKIYGLYKNWDTFATFTPSRNEIYYRNSEYQTNVGIKTSSTFMNYDRLYDNIVKQQQRIPEGEVVTPENGVIRIKIGGTYTIEDVSNVREIIYDDFDSNKDKLTIITIKNSGNVTLPIVTKDKEFKYIETNDYKGKKVANQYYERNGLLPEDYYGNVVINMPNANFIKLGDNAPFAAHLIAPNADVETNETQIAGCIIANSFYAELNTELHFYPINVEKTDCADIKNLSTDLQAKLQDIWLYRTLGGEDSDIEKVVIGNQAQYKADYEDIEYALRCERKIIVNPETFGNIIALILISSIVVGGIVLYKKKKVA